MNTKIKINKTILKITSVLAMMIFMIFSTFTSVNASAHTASDGGYCMAHNKALSSSYLDNLVKLKEFGPDNLNEYVTYVMWQHQTGYDDLVCSEDIQNTVWSSDLEEITEACQNITEFKVIGSELGGISIFHEEALNYAKTDKAI